MSDELDAHPAFTASAKEPHEPPGPPGDFRPDAGEPVFRIKIPKIDLNHGRGFVVVEGVDAEQLDLGPGHYPQCRTDLAVELCTEQPEVWPGGRGRMIVSGHRTTHSQPFFHLEEVERGDAVTIETWWGDFTYVVTKQEIVDDQATHIANPAATHRRQLVLTTCNPRYFSSERLIVYAELSDWETLPKAGRRAR